MEDAVGPAGLSPSEASRLRTRRPPRPRPRHGAGEVTATHTTSEGCRYAAFISYRHVEPDRTWAKWLHGALETFRTPKALVQQGMPERLGRVFRDEEEVPASHSLSAEIDAALEQSRYLIV